MKLTLFCVLIFSSDAYFTGCPMDGCDSALTGFVDVSIDGFAEHVEWQLADLVTAPTRGCVSNERSSLLCAIDQGYASINVTDGQLLWSISLDVEQSRTPASLPVLNNAGFSIIANSTRCSLISPQGRVAGTFDYEPTLIAPLAGPFVTDDGQIVVADSFSVGEKTLIDSFDAR